MVCAGQGLNHEHSCFGFQVVHSGEISEQAPMAPVTDNMLRANEVREGALVALDQQVTCNVAFSRGEERRVFFAIHGLPQVVPAVTCSVLPAFLRVSFCCVCAGAEVLDALVVGTCEAAVLHVGTIQAELQRLSLVFVVVEASEACFHV